MSRPTRTLLLATWTIAAMTMTVSSANAYVDGGSTAVIFQAIVAFLAAAGTGFAMFRQKISSLFRKDKPATGTEAPVSEDV